MKLRVKIDLIFIVTVIIVAVLMYITFQNVNYVKDSSDLVNKTNTFLYTLENLESSVVKVEASSRGYIISGNENLLDRMEEAKKEVFANLEKIGQQHNADLNVFHHLEQLEYLINEKISNSENGVDLKKNEGKEKAMESVSTGKGKKLMDEISDIIKDIEKEEFELLSAAVTQNKVHAVNQNNMYKVLSLFIFSVLLIFHYHIRKSTFEVFSYKEKQADLIKELNYQNKQLDDFVHIITHNVRSPANNITSLISLVNEESNPAEVKFILEKLGKVSGSLNETLNELIEVIQIKQNVGVQRQQLDFKEIYDKVYDSMQGDIIMKGAAITCNFEACPSIRYPKTYLESIMHNLLSNAIKYNSPKREPKINLSTYLVQGKPVLKISDNGLGMDLKRIGDKLFGLRKTFHTMENSKGIGLFMTKTHIESLGGEIKVESEVDKGTTFIVYFDKLAQGKQEKGFSNKTTSKPINYPPLEGYNPPNVTLT